MSVGNLIAAVLSQGGAGGGGAGGSFGNLNMLWGWGFINRNPDYDGPAYRARNASTNEEVDVGFDEDGKCRDVPYGTQTRAYVLYDQWGSSDLNIGSAGGEVVNVLPPDATFDTARLEHTYNGFVDLTIPGIQGASNVVAGTGFVRAAGMDDRGTSPLFHYVGTGSVGFSILHSADEFRLAVNEYSPPDGDPTGVTNGNTGSPGYLWGDLSTVIFDMADPASGSRLYGNDGNVLLTKAGTSAPNMAQNGHKLVFTRHPSGWFMGERTEMWVGSAPDGLDPADAANMVAAMREVLN